MKNAQSPLQAAIEYANRGWSVIPIRRDESKRPYVKWAEFQDEAASEKQIREWFTRWPNANIGIITGRVSGIVAIDVDPRHGGDTDAMLEEAPTDLVAITGSGGAHLLYKYPNEMVNVPNRAGLRPGIDVRGDGGYIVVAPSVHQSGNVYRWQTTGRPRKMPQKILSAILSGQDNERHADGQEKWISEALQGVSEGTRNDTCTKLAGYFLSKGCPKDITIAVLRHWNECNDVPLRDKDLETVVESVSKTQKRRHRLSPLPNQKPGKPFTFMPLESYMTEHCGQETSWLIQDWMPDKTIALLVAAPGSYKTWMLLDLAVSVASGTDFLGLYPVSCTGPVLVIQQEDPLNGVADRLSAIVSSRFETGLTVSGDEFTIHRPPYMPIFLHPDRNLRFDNQRIMDALEDKIREIRPKLVLIDPLYSAASSDDYMAKSVEHMWRLKKMRDEYGCSFVIAHHTAKRGLQKKKEEPTTGREELWGSQFLNAFLETGWQMRCLEGSSIIVRRHFKVSDNKPAITLTFEIDTKSPKAIYTVREQDARSIALADDASESILSTLADGAKTQSELREITQVKKSTLCRKLKRLCDDELIVLGTQGRYTLWPPDES